MKYYSETGSMATENEWKTLQPISSELQPPSSIAFFCSLLDHHHCNPSNDPQKGIYTFTLLSLVRDELD